MITFSIKISVATLKPVNLSCDQYIFRVACSDDFFPTRVLPVEVKYLSIIINDGALTSLVVSSIMIKSTRSLTVKLSSMLVTTC